MILERDFALLSDKSKHHFQRLISAADRMQLLLNDLLAYTKINMAVTNFEVTDLNHILNQVKEHLNETIEENQAVISAENLPTIKGIPFQLSQLFENLISNSIKYRKDNIDPVIQIKCSTVPQKEMDKSFQAQGSYYYKISISDNGIGFGQKYADKVFDLFSRLPNNKEYPGTGIGLTICKKIIQNHNGFIKVYSEAEKGTQINIYFSTEN